MADRQGVEPRVEESDHAAGEPSDLREAGWVDRLRALHAWGARELWHYDPAEPVGIRALRSAAQLVALTVRGFGSDKLLLRASALTYITALSIIPMLGVAFAILGMVGGNETLIDFAIDQLTTVAPEVRETVHGYVGNLDLARFGAVGGALVFGTAIFALRHLEGTLNDIWGVSRSRTWPRRLSDYLTVMVVAPISTGVAVSLGTTLQNDTVVGRLLEYPGFAQLYGLGLRQVPLLFLFVGFSFLYWFFPNTQVRLRAAALGGFVAAVLFTAARAVYVQFQVGAATYEAVFGALSAVPLILAWLYACWAIVLLGAEVAYATQNLRSARREMNAGEMSPEERELVSLEIAVAIARAFRTGGGPPTAEELADELETPTRDVRRLTGVLEAAGLVRTVWGADEERGACFVPGRPIGRLTVGDVLRAVRREGSKRALVPRGRDPKVGATMERLTGAWGDVADSTTLESLVAGETPPFAGSPDAAFV